MRSGVCTLPMSAKPKITAAGSLPRLSPVRSPVWHDITNPLPFGHGRLPASYAGEPARSKSHNPAAAPLGAPRPV